MTTKELILTFFVVVFTSCTTQFISKKKILKQEKTIETIATYCVKNKIEELNLDSFPDIKIRQEIKKLKVKYAATTGYYYDNDSLDKFIELSGFYRSGLGKYSSRGRYIKIIFNISSIGTNSKREERFSEQYHFKKVNNKIYYEKGKYVE